MKNVYLVPTKSKSILHFDHTGLFPSKNYQLSSEINSVVDGYDLHITSDDKVNLNDYFIVELFKIDGSSDGYHLEKCIDIKDQVWVNSNDIIYRQAIEGVYENYFVRFLDTEETTKVYDDNDMIKFVNWCEDNYFSLSGKEMWCESPDFENNKVFTTKELLDKFKKIDKLL